MKVPEVESLVGRHRHALDPSAELGVPAHVTLLYPFLPPSEIDADVLGRLKIAINSHRKFDVEFASTRWFGDQVLWLSPDPDSPFRRLTGALVAAFPETSPYGGTILDPTPHLTIADGASLHEMRAAESVVITQLPIRACFDSVSVMIGASAPNSWMTIADIPLTRK